MITKDLLFQQLSTRCYAQIPFEVSPREIQDVMTSFFKFLELPDDVKSHIDFTISPQHRRGDIGFKHREAQDDIYNDNKDFFHFHPAIFERYEDFIKTQPVLEDFLKKAQGIWKKTYATVEQIFDLLDDEYPGSKARVFDTPDVHVVLRFLKYEWHTSGKYLAKPHFDAGCSTLALAESCPGLRIGRGPEDLTPVEHKPGNAVFMLSSNIEKTLGVSLSDTPLKPSWHDVIQMDETQIGKPFARWALVAFIEAHGVEALPRTETHKWYKGEAA